MMKKCNLPYSDELVLITETSSIESGYDAAMHMLHYSQPPTAFFLANDVMAIGAINAARECGLVVPKDISVVGFDDIPLASFVNPPLTTVRQPAFKKGVNAARMLIEYLESHEMPPSLTMDVELIVRQSTGQAPR
jgi:DNA-binding LacI/PurR family transcriptional regulator